MNLFTPNYPKEKWQNITLSLAGLFQAARLVRDIARTGQLDPIALEGSIQSILKTESDSILDMYGNLNHLQLGLKEIQQLLKKNKKTKEAETIRYIVSLLYLEKKFSQSPALRKTLSRRIQQAQSQATHFELTDPVVIQTLGSAFLQTLGQFRYRIQIVGNINYLKQQEIVTKIRALLLAGIRAAVLWRQMGGTKWQLFFSRKKIKATAEELLKSAAKTAT